MTDASRILLDLARRVTAGYARLPEIRAILVTGSTAEGEADFSSDLDLILYYDPELPSAEVLESLRAENGGTDPNVFYDAREEGAFAEAYFVSGVQCQLVHTTVTNWEREMASILDDHTVDTPLQKALGGVIAGIALHGEEVIAEWKRHLADYPDALAEAMVRHHLQFFPLWGLATYLDARDTTIFRYQMLVESAQHLLGVLAGLNRIYYTPFQLKRTHKLAAAMALRPENLADRLENLFRLDPLASAEELRSLIAETLALLDVQMPSIETGALRKRLEWKHKAWRE